jgi:hypothetical protein
MEGGWRDLNRINRKGEGHWATGNVDLDLMRFSVESL